jgi:hypothetical protein
MAVAIAITTIIPGLNIAVITIMSGLNTSNARSLVKICRMLFAKLVPQHTHTWTLGKKTMKEEEVVKQ